MPIHLSNDGPNDEQDGDELVSGDYSTFDHPSGLFSLDIPSDWQVRDESAPGMVITSFVSPDAQALVRVAVNAAPADDSDDGLAAALQQFIEATAGSEKNFALEEWEVDDDDIIWMGYSYELNGTPTVGDAYIWIDEDYAVLIAAAMPEDADEELQATVEDIGDSLGVDSSANLP